MIGFVIWTLVVIIFIVIGVHDWKSDKAVGFFTGTEPPKIPETNVKKYNHAVAKIWFVFGAIYEIIGLPMLLFEQNSPYFIFMIFGSIVWAIGLMISYLLVQNHYMKE